MREETKIVRRQFFHLRAKDRTFIPKNLVSCHIHSPSSPLPSLFEVKRQKATEVPKTLPFVSTNQNTSRVVTSTLKGVSCRPLKNTPCLRSKRTIIGYCVCFRCITMIDISMVMIQSTGFHEVLAMQSSTVCALWGHLQRAIESKWLVKIAFGTQSHLIHVPVISFCCSGVSSWNFLMPF